MGAAPTWNVYASAPLMVVVAVAVADLGGVGVANLAWVCAVDNWEARTRNSELVMVVREAQVVPQLPGR